MSAVCAKSVASVHVGEFGAPSTPSAWVDVGVVEFESSPRIYRGGRVCVEEKLIERAIIETVIVERKGEIIVRSGIRVNNRIYFA